MANLTINEQPAPMSDFDRLLASITGGAEALASSYASVRDTIAPATPATSQPASNSATTTPRNDAGGIFTGTSAIGLPNSLLWVAAAGLTFFLVRDKF